MLACADFETTTLVNDCRVWAYGICEIGNPTNFIYGTSLDEFMFIHCANKRENHTFYFHNLKFDGEFIFYWLFRNGFTHVKNRKELVKNTFCTLISDKGAFYSTEVCFSKIGKKVNKVTFYCSLKILNFSVDKIGKNFDLGVNKLEVDKSFYKLDRPVGHVLTQLEIDYLRNDVEVVARALDVMFNEGMTEMTIGSNALSEYKNIVGKQNFNKTFPIPSYDADVRQAYKGGWTYLNPKFKDKSIKDGIVLDVNSLYPHVMYSKKLPYGEGICFEGEYVEDKLYCLYVQKLNCMFELKEGCLPSIQIKHDLNFIPTAYLENSRDRNGVMIEVELCLTNIDLKLFLEHYEVYNLVYVNGYKFKGSIGLFKAYIDKWTKVKIESSINGNEAMRTIAKLMLNTLYGKLALNPIVRSKYPIYNNEKDKVNYMYGEYEERTPIYIPCGAFITSYAREMTIRTGQAVYDRFIYADTDSLHLVGTELPKGIIIDDNELGCWAHELTIIKGKYLRQKCYMETGYEPKKPDKIFTKVTCAGMPESCHNGVNYDNFKIGSKFDGKLQATHVSGGIVLLDNHFTIKNTLI